MKRLDFLRNKFNVLPNQEYHKFMVDKGVVGPKTEYKDIIGVHKHYCYIPEEGLLFFPEDTFQDIIGADPTKNRMYVQWIMGILIDKIEVGESLGANNATIFLREDLPKTLENLKLFEGNKRKKKFRSMAKKNHALDKIKDVSDIIQYTDLEELFAAVYPFKPVVDKSELVEQMEYFVSIGEGLLPVQDEFYTVFIPKTLKASELFGFTNWCTASTGNTMFKHYTTNNLKPDGNPSDLIIVIDNGFLRGENENIYQIHFETSQIMDKKDSSYRNLRSDIIDKNISVRNFFHKTLYDLIKASYDKERNSNQSYMFGKEGSNYVKYLLQFGFGEIMFDVMDGTVPTISFVDCSIGELPDLSRFTEVSTLYFDNVGINKLEDTFFTSKHLKMVSIPRNNVSKIPETIGNCKRLVFMNVKGNPIGYIPESIKYLDPTNGGSLEKISIDGTCEQAIEKLKKLLPSVVIA